MTPCTAKDVEELNTRLLHEFVENCVDRLRDELRANSQIRDGVRSSIMPVQENGKASNNIFPEKERPVNCRASQGEAWHNLGQLPPSPMEQRINEAVEEWSGEIWADADETQWLLSVPFGPQTVPHNSSRQDLKELSLFHNADDSLDHEEHHDPESFFAYAVANWFQAVSACVIMLNTLMVLLESTDPETSICFFWPGQLMLAFYVFELASRMCYFGRNYLRGSNTFLAWNVFDCVVVFAGVFRQWILPCFPGLMGENMGAGLQILRSLRILRVLRVLRVFFASDLSWTEEPRFQSFIGLVIAFNALLMGFETDFQWRGFFYIEQVLLIIYVFELSVRLKRFSLQFLSLSNPDFNWNLIDLVIVTSSVLDSWVVPLIVRCANSLSQAEDSRQRSNTQTTGGGMNLGQIMMLMRMLRLMRILRLARLIKSIKPLYILVASITAAFQGVIWVLLFTLVVLYALGIFATRLIGHRMIFPPDTVVEESAIQPFSTVWISMFTLFRLMSGSASGDESGAVDSVMERVPWFKFAFVFFMITSSWTLLSILTAVVSEVMISTTAAQEYEMKLQTDDEDRALLTEDLAVLFEKIDTSGNGSISMSELLEFLKKDNNSLDTAKMCRVPVRDLVKVFRTLAQEGEDITFNHFSECMMCVGEPVTERSIMRLESQIRDVQRMVLGLPMKH